MARLSDQDVSRLIASLAPASEGLPATRPSETQLGYDPTGMQPPIKELQEQLSSLVTYGSVGPLLTQRLATYLGKPVRCACSDEAPRDSDGPLYLSRAGGVLMWLRMDPLLASAISDAMIGGDGEAAKVGYGAKVTRVAAFAASEMIRAIATVLDLPEPAQAVLDGDGHRPAAQAGGTLSVGVHEYQWQVGLSAVERDETQVPATHHAPSSFSIPGADAAIGHGESAREILEASLEAARRQLVEMAGGEVAFEELEVATLAAPRMPQGWLRLSLASRDGGAIVLAVDKGTAALLVNRALGADIVSAEDGGTLLETGSEVLVRAALYALGSVLGSTPDELHHIVRLSDDAILADLSHYSIEHRVRFANKVGSLRWLIPTRLVRLRSPMPGRLRSFR